LIKEAAELASGYPAPGVPHSGSVESR
jgi:hypothetical protein